MLELPESPAELGLPFDAWRQSQDEMVLFGVEQHGARIRVIEAPTGYGKSAIPAVASRLGIPVVSLVGTRDLQAQYAKSFDWLRVVWGQGNYKCILPTWVERFEKLYDERPTVADCPFANHPSSCPVFSDCPYHKAKREAARAKALVTNYAYAFLTNWWRDAFADGMVVMDEAHLLPKIMSNLISINISERTRRRFGFKDFPLINGYTRTHYKMASAWLDDAIEVLTRFIRFNATPKTANRLNTTLRSYTRLRNRLLKADTYEFYISSGIKLGCLTARPIDISKELFFSRFVPSNTNLVFMSATIGDPDLLLGELGLSDVEFDYRSYPHIFEQRNRRVYLLRNAPKLSARSTYSDYAKQIDLISDILRKHEGERGIIHTTSWRHTGILEEGLRVNFNNRIYIPTGDRVEAVNRFIRGGNNLVAISPSWSEGLDFHDDLARFAIIAKVPFPSLADPVIKIKLKRSGRRWYDWNAAMRIVQSAGRIVRHEDDWGTTYIVDGYWSRVARFAPSWFKVDDISTV